MKALGQYTNSIVPAGQTALFFSPDFLAGYHDLFEFPLQGTGIFSVNFSAPSNVSQDIAVFTDVISDNDISAKLFPSSTKITEGKAAVFSLALFDGQTPLTGATITSEFKFPNGTTAPILFSDSGVGDDYQASDGIYSAHYLPNTIGEYTITARVSGTKSPNTPYAILSYAKFVVNPFIGRLTGQVDDAGVDDNADGLFDKITVESEVETTQPGEIGIFVHLKTPNGQYIVRNGRAQLDTLMGLCSFGKLSDKNTPTSECGDRSYVAAVDFCDPFCNRESQTGTAAQLTI